MLTPKTYWRIARTLEALTQAPPRDLELPSCLVQRNKPPRTGDGVLLADYDHDEQLGQVRYLGLIEGWRGSNISVNWKPVELQIWVDTGTGRNYWKNFEGFAFAEKKLTDYGLHDIFATCFDGLEARESVPLTPSGPAAARRERTSRSRIPKERLVPMETVGEPSNSPEGGYIYLIQSAYGYKLGRSRRLPDRMRTFGVQLPFLYSIPLCAWFDNHVEAETRYHRLFHDQRINGEWFSLHDADIELVRARRFE